MLDDDITYTVNQSSKISLESHRSLGLDIKPFTCVGLSRVHSNMLSYLDPLHIHKFGSFGNSPDTIDVDVVISLDSNIGKALGFKLRKYKDTFLCVLILVKTDEPINISYPKLVKNVF